MQNQQLDTFAKAKQPSTGMQLLKNWQQLYGESAEKVQNAKVSPSKRRNLSDQIKLPLKEPQNLEQLNQIKQLILQQESNIFRQFQELIKNYQLQDQLTLLQSMGGKSHNSQLNRVMVNEEIIRQY